jgi:hypothetical protein
MEDPERQCPICLNEPELGNLIPCKHQLCLPCFNEFKRRNMSTCPLCRGKIEYFKLENNVYYFENDCWSIRSFTFKTVVTIFLFYLGTFTVVCLGDRFFSSG